MGGLSYTIDGCGMSNDEYKEETLKLLKSINKKLSKLVK